MISNINNVKLIFLDSWRLAIRFRPYHSAIVWGHLTIHYIVKKVCQVIIDNLFAEVMSQLTVKDRERISDEFWKIWNFPNCLGALDGKHVEIFVSPNNGSQYFNYKRTFSINLLALVDANYKFIAINVGSYGKNNDGGIFANSNLGKALEKN